MAQPVQVEGGAVVSGAAQRAEQLSSKLFANGGFRDSAKIFKLLPRGGAGLQAKVPRRKNYGAEAGGRGWRCGALHRDEGVWVKQFGSSHVKGETIETRMNYVGLFGSSGTGCNTTATASTLIGFVYREGSGALKNAGG